MPSKLIARLKSLPLFIYTWLAAVYFGAILIDIIYARILNQPGITADLAIVFRSISDVLLLAWTLVIFAAVVACVLSWTSKPARYLFMTSLAIFVLELLTPQVISISGLSGQLPEARWLFRLLFSGLAAWLALLGLISYGWQD